MLLFQIMFENHQRGRSIETKENEDVDQIHYGLRCPRYKTTWVYQDSSSLSPEQIMEQDVYLHAAKDSIFASFSILQNITALAVSYHTMQNLIQSLLTLNPKELNYKIVLTFAEVLSLWFHTIPFHCQWLDSDNFHSIYIISFLQ